MNIFARALGGIFADKVGAKYGMRGKGILLASMLAIEGIGIVLFASSGNLTMAIMSMLTFAMFLKMANGATFAIVPFVNPKAVGIISGVVGAGGNIGGMLMGFLFKSKDISYGQAFMYIGIVVAIMGFVLYLVNFDKKIFVEERSLAEVA
jgi:MFS transporter, NNP family, nitrate/nitrite transporter